MCGDARSSQIVREKFGALKLGGIDPLPTHRIGLGCKRVSALEGLQNGQHWW